MAWRSLLSLTLSKVHRRSLWLVLLPLLFAVPALRADYVVRQQMQSGNATAVITFKFKGDLGRIDLPNGQGESSSIIMDLKKDVLINLQTTQRVAYRSTLSKRRAKTEAAMKANGVDVDALRPVPTGRKEKVGEYDAEEFVLEVLGTKLRIWVARDFPNGYAIKTQLARFCKANSGGALNPDAMLLPGIVVKYEGPGPGGLTTTTLLSAHEEPVPDATFEIPPSFQTRPLPAELGG